MKLLMLFVDGFEDTEAIATLDVLKRGGDIVTTVSLMNREYINPKYIKEVKVDTLVNNINKEEYDGLIIPGGPGSFKIMPLIKEVEELINYFATSNKLVASICAAPHLVGKLGYLKGRDFTCHPGFEDQVIGGHYLRNKGVVVSDNFITAKSMYYSIAFGLAIHEYFHGEESKNALERALQGE